VRHRLRWRRSNWTSVTMGNSNLPPFIWLKISTDTPRAAGRGAIHRDDAEDLIAKIQKSLWSSAPRSATIARCAKFCAGRPQWRCDPVSQIDHGGILCAAAKNLVQASIEHEYSLHRFWFINGRKERRLTLVRFRRVWATAAPVRKRVHMDLWRPAADPFSATLEFVQSARDEATRVRSLPVRDRERPVRTPYQPAVHSRRPGRV